MAPLALHPFAKGQGVRRLGCRPSPCHRSETFRAAGCRRASPLSDRCHARRHGRKPPPRSPSPSSTRQGRSVACRRRRRSAGLPALRDQAAPGAAGDRERRRGSLRPRRAELALACASHSGETAHAATVLRLLARARPRPQISNAAPPALSRADAARAARGRARRPRAQQLLGQACRHAGDRGASRRADARLYPRRAPGPAARRARARARCAGSTSHRRRVGIDGCGLPPIGIPLETLALGMARLADPASCPRSGAPRPSASAAPSPPIRSWSPAAAASAPRSWSS